MQFAPVNLIEVIERVIHLLKGEFHSDLQWQRDYDPSLPPVQGGKDQLIQAILNTRNACQALQQTKRARVVFKTRVVRQFTIGSVRHRQIMPEYYRQRPRHSGRSYRPNILSHDQRSQ